MELHGTYKISQITSKCPDCGKEVGSDLGTNPLKPNTEAVVRFFCVEHGTWIEYMTITVSLTPRTCEWETVVPPKICGKPAAFLASGKPLCRDHGMPVARRFPLVVKPI